MSAQATNAGRRIKLWQVLLAIIVVGVGLASLPEHIGIPLFVVIEGALIVTLLVLFVVGICRKAASRRSLRRERLDS